MSQKKVLYFHSVKSSFVRKDVALLEQHFDVKITFFDPSNKFLVPFQFLKQWAFLIANIWSADILITQFGGYQSYLPSRFGKIFGKPSLIILGGSDCVNFPSINYGNFNKKLLGLFTKWSYMNATHLSPVHKSLVQGPYTYTNDDFEEQGYLKYCPKVTADFTELHYGYDHQLFQGSENKIPNSFITVGYLNNANYYRKGIDLIFGLAKAKPNYVFTIVGGTIEDLPVRDVPENVKMVKSVSYEELKDLYGTHQFYFQLSICEGFPSAICEAMLCGCIPIGSDVAAIPQIIGESGFVLKKKDAQELELLIDEALQSDLQARSKQARQHIMNHYPINEREKLIQLVNRLMEN